MLVLTIHSNPCCSQVSLARVGAEEGLVELSSFELPPAAEDAVDEVLEALRAEVSVLVGRVPAALGLVGDQVVLLAAEEVVDLGLLVLVHEGEGQGVVLIGSKQGLHLLDQLARGVGEEQDANVGGTLLAHA